MNANQKAKCSRILKHYGEQHQMLKTVEECSELSRALSRYLQNRNTLKSVEATKNLREEMADCYIMLEQVSQIFDELDIKSCIDYKLDRTLQRIKDGEQ